MNENYTGGTYIRIISPKQGGNPFKRENEDYTFLHDIIGKGFFFRGVDLNDFDHDYFHLSGDILPLINKFKDIADAVAPKNESDFISMRSDYWHGFKHWLDKEES